MELNLTANTPAEEKILQYLKENASETLAEKINNGTPFEKDGKSLINKKTLAGFMKYACEEARKTVESGSSSACIEDPVVYGWAVHYFEEESIEGTLYTLDGEEYKPAVKTKNIQKSTYTPTSAPKPQKKVSPVYTEYAALREKYPDCVIAYRLGDFYEILGKDAVTIATELDLTLTGRDCGLDHRIPMIGFPYHAADNYISEIINRGHKIAVVEKSDDINILPKETHCVIDEDTGEILSEKEMREFDGDIEEPDELEEEKAIAKAFDTEAVCELSELLGDCFILV